VDGTIEIDGEQVPAYIDVNGEKKSIYVDRAHMVDSRHGKLACISCHIGFNPGRHPESVTQDWLRTAKFEACGDCHGPEALMYQTPSTAPCRSPRTATRLRSARLPRRAQHPLTGHGGVPLQPDDDVHALSRRQGGHLPRQLPGKAYLLGDEKTAVCVDCHGATASCRPPTRRARSPRRTSSRRAPGVIPGQRELRRLRGARQSQDPRSSWQIWFFWIAYVALIAVVFSFAAVHTSLYIYRGAKEASIHASTIPAGAQGR